MAHAWERLTGSIAGQKYTLDKLLSVREDQAWFDAHRVDSPDDRVTVHFSPPAALTPALQHAHLRAILDAGEHLVDNCQFRYIVLEPADELLSGELASQGALSTSDVRQLAAHLIGALEFLHANQLVYCNLQPSTVARIGGAWKLADFTELRPAGQTHPKRTRRLLVSSPQAPPDAYTGLVTPAWDIYSLGVTLRECLLGEDAARLAHPPRLPDPFEPVVRRCLQPNPEHRISLGEIALMLGIARFSDPAPAPRAKPPAPVAPSKPSRWPRAGALAAAALLPALLFFVNARTQEHPIQVAAQSIAPPEPAPSADRPESEAPPDPALARRQINVLLQRWISTLQALDLDGHLDCYAPVVEPFGGVAQADRPSIRREKAAIFAGARHIRQTGFDHLRFQSLDPGQAVVSLNKEWEVDGADPSRVVEDVRLTLRWTGGEWKIAGEEESNVRIFIR